MEAEKFDKGDRVRWMDKGVERVGTVYLEKHPMYRIEYTKDADDFSHFTTVSSYRMERVGNEEAG